MNDTQIIASRIKEQTKNMNLSVKALLEKCELSKNLVNKLANGSDIGTQSIARIADYLECSVDYLLGRTDSPAIEKNVKQNDNHGLNMGINAVELSVPVTIPPQELDENQAELLKYFGMLGYEEKLNFMQTLIKQAKEQQK